MSSSNSNEDLSNGWEAVAHRFIAERSTYIGAATVENWARSFAAGQALLDVGCGFGGPYTQALIDMGIRVYGIDASNTLINEYRKRFPGVIAKCEAAEGSSFFGKKFAGVLSVGLIFLLSETAQVSLLRKMAMALKENGRLLFNAPCQTVDWRDLSTGRKSLSLGRDVYITTLQEHGLSFIEEYVDEGNSHYYDFQK